MSVAPSTSKATISCEQLRNIGLFGALSDDALQLLSQRLTTVALIAGEQLFAQGDCGRALFVVLDGEVLLRRYPQPPLAGEPLVLARYRAGEWFGERAVIDVMPRSYTAGATEPSRLLKMRATDCDALYRHSVKAYALLMMNIARQISRKLHVLQRRLLAQQQH